MKAADKSHRLQIASALLVAVWMTGCVSGPKRNPVPPNLTGNAQVVGMPGVRMIMDPFAAKPPPFEASLEPASQFARNKPGPLTLLAISGGGADGAFGAGLLNGWTASGNRPSFDIVAGVSTGALIAPLAFLGPDMDDKLKTGYTTVTDKDIYRKRGIFSILWHWDATMDPTPLYEYLYREWDEQHLALIAAEHRKGRRLYVGTTDLDAQALVAWDMGAIAASGHPKAREIFCRAMLASASIPVAFPPVRFEVEADGQTYNELHVDGGVLSQVFGMGLLGKLMQLSGRNQGQLFVLRNSQLSLEYKKTEPSLTSIAGRSIGSLTKANGLGDIYRAYVVAKEQGLDFNLAGIPASFDRGNQRGMFDRDYMSRLYQVGYDLGLSGAAWQKEPPAVQFMRGQ